MNEVLSRDMSGMEANTLPEIGLSRNPFRLCQGDCWAFFAFDIGHGIDLEMAQKMLASKGAGHEEARRAEISHKRRAEKYLQFRPAPLQIDQAGVEPLTLELTGFRAEPRVECTLYDFGAISVAYRISLGGDGDGVELKSLVPLAEALGDNQDLAADARRRVKELALRLDQAIERPLIVELVEDYIVYHIRRWSPASDAQSVINSDRETIARILLAEPGPLSGQAIDSALAEQLSYSPHDLAVIDWNAALLIDARAEDALAVLEFANVELLELRYIDDRLDSIFDRSYASFLRRDARKRLGGSPLRFLLDPHQAERRRLAALQMEGAILFEGINNTLKLLGDQHLARLYAIAARRLHLAEWDQSILRKLHTADGLFQKLADEHSGRRMEVLEWIIILLIAISIVLPFILGGSK